MRQETFRTRAKARWSATETMIGMLDRKKKKDTEQFPFLYRQLCHDLAIARDRHFDVSLVDHLNRMAIRGHQHLYRPKRFSLEKAATFVKIHLPNAVRKELGPVIIALALLFGSMASIAFIVHKYPVLIYSIVPAEQVRRIETMYDPDSERFLRPIEHESRFAMFGFYILNNISISFRVFAGGILVGVGSIFVLLFNGVFLGAITGHLIRLGYGSTFFTFVSSHSALELVAIALSGVSGLRLGWSLIAPGRMTRGESLRHAARSAVPLLYGSVIMLTLAALIEAFWSPLPLPIVVKYGFGIAWWLVLFCYFFLSGRKHAI